LLAVQVIEDAVVAANRHIHDANSLAGLVVDFRSAQVGLDRALAAREHTDSPARDLTR
jgi:hypothetical protein